MFINKKFILASTSSSRYKILKKVGLNFKTTPPLCNEGVLKKKLIKTKNTPKKISLELSRQKAKSISLLKKNYIVVGSDTVIDFCGKQVDKAKNMKEAKNKIKQLSGKTHNIYSSASVFFNSKEIWHKTQKTKIKIRKLKDSDIDKYLFAVGKKILNSAGCYEVEKLGPNIIENINGDFFNTMGFPLFPFLVFLEKQFNKKNQ